MTAQSATPSHPAEMVGAIEGVDLSRGGTTTEFAIRPPTGPASAAFAAGAPRHTYLNLENVTGAGPIINHEVYVNLPEGSIDDSGRQELLAGVLPMFGVREASRATDKHGGGGKTYVFDITEMVRRLTAERRWDPAKVRVTFIPTGKTHPDAQLRVGRVSVYTQ